MVIRMRHTRSHTKNRRSHHALKAPALSVCSHCGAKHRPHHMCLECGYYNGRQVMDLEAAKIKRTARMKEKRDRIRTQIGAPGPDTTASVTETVEEAPKTDNSKKAKEENLQDKKPDRRDDE